jgi:hypothetical protein
MLGGPTVSVTFARESSGTSAPELVLKEIFER